MAALSLLPRSRCSSTSASRSIPGCPAILTGPDGTKLTLFAQVGGNGANFTNTIFSDSAALSITAGSAPFTGSFRPSGAGGLALFNGKSIEGDWTLELINTRGGTVGTLNGWSLSVTPVISVTPVNPVSGVAKTFSVNFPRQSLSGTYTVQLGPDILDTNGQRLDTNLNAGLDVLRGESSNVPTTTVAYGSGPVNQSLVGGQIVSRINVPENFLIQGLTASGRSGLRIQLNLSTPNVAPLSATLVYHPALPTRLPWFCSPVSLRGRARAGSLIRFSTTTPRLRSARRSAVLRRIVCSQEPLADDAWDSRLQRLPGASFWRYMGACDSEQRRYTRHAQ